MQDPFFLDRFVRAQDGVYAEAVAELRNGHRHGEWIWFIFPQMKGLGHAPQAAYYGISSLDEAAAYLSHPVLGPRLVECTRLVNEVEARTIQEIFGVPEDLKFRSSMTLFAHAAEDDTVFRTALEKYFEGEPDLLTLELMR